jgi:uncharacterized protein YbbC (DUF1343 family)
VRFTPNTSVFKDKECLGVNIVVVDRARFNPLRTGIEIAVALRRLYPNNWKVDDYGRLLVNAETLERVKRAEAPEEIVRSWRSALEAFNQRRAAALLYQ